MSESRSTMEIRPMVGEQEAREFARLNRLWIEELFDLTDEDEHLLVDPETTIRDAGGEVLLAVDDDQVQGGVALLPAGEGRYELAKMTVAAQSRSRGTGAQLIAAAIGWATAQDAHVLFLVTSTRLPAAIRLYERAGFRASTAAELGLTEYAARADRFMRLELRASC